MKVAGADRIFLPRWRSKAVSIPDHEVTMKVGRTKEEGQHMVTLNELRPLIDKWTDAAAEDATNYVKAK
jgi:hypothetical protein